MDANDENIYLIIERDMCLISKRRLNKWKEKLLEEMMIALEKNDELISDEMTRLKGPL